MRLLSRILNVFSDFLFPKSRRVLELEALSSGKLLKLLPPATEVTGEDTIALFDYQHSLVKEIIWEVKYGGNTMLAGKLGEILFDVISTELAERGLFEKFDTPLLIPMPVSDKRRNERGWNQAEILCEAVVKTDTNKTLKYKPRQLVKHYHTESQTKTASKKERSENLKNSMKVLAPSVIENQFIILVDDVMTTGSTFNEAKRALRDAGAKKILCIAVAH
jgi:ComF family protein